MDASAKPPQSRAPLAPSVLPRHPPSMPVQSGLSWTALGGHVPPFRPWSLSTGHEPLPWSPATTPAATVGTAGRPGVALPPWAPAVNVAALSGGDAGGGPVSTPSHHCYPDHDYPRPFAAEAATGTEATTAATAEEATTTAAAAAAAATAAVSLAQWSAAASAVGVHVPTGTLLPEMPPLDATAGTTPAAAVTAAAAAAVASAADQSSPPPPPPPPPLLPPRPDG